MNLPGFAAEAALPKSFRPLVVTGASTVLRPDAPVIPAQFSLPPILCPVDHEPVLVKTGGKQVCTKLLPDICYNVGTPWEKCYPGGCVEWGISPIEYRWECYPRLMTLEPFGIGWPDYR